MATLRLMVFLLSALALTGCLGGGEPDVATAPGFEPCLHPWPCADGTEWPLGLTGPFEVLPVEHVMVPSHDGVELHAWLWRADLPVGVKAPTILMSTPYLGAADGQEQLEQLYLPPILNQYVPNGYAYVIVEVRGTGASGGCFGHHDMDAQLDPAAVVDWIAAQDWSNGRVGMAGMSYMGVATMHGAIHAGPALKAVAPVAIPQQYLYHFTPQGAFSTSAAGYEATQHTVVTPPVALMTGTALTLASLGHASDRVCPEFVRNALAEPIAMLADDRDAAFWEVRDAFRSYGGITAATYIMEGFNDAYIPWGQDVAWDLLQGPKRILFGQWGHEMPPVEGLGAMRLAWFDFWLKGIGDVPGIGIVTYQDDGAGWHDSTSWPPAEATDHALYLTRSGLGPAADAGTFTYRSAPVAPGQTPDARLCDPTLPVAYSFVSEPAEVSTLIAGNPMALLNLESDLPGGIVGLYLYKLPEGAPCSGSVLLTWGAADLRFHAGNLVGTDFPTGTPVEVRVDMEVVAARLEPGDRIALLATHPGPYDDRDTDDLERVQPHGPGSAGRSGQPYLPQVTLHGGTAAEASHVVLPLVEGTLGASAPVREYPARPFSGA